MTKSDRDSRGPLLHYYAEDKEDRTFEFEFTKRGNHLYYCTPHGSPFEYHDLYNSVGMRGAVTVAGKELSD